MPYDKEAFASYLRRKQERRRAAEDMTRRMIERSVKQIAHSKELLSKEVPKVWHPRAPGIPSILHLLKDQLTWIKKCRLLLEDHGRIKPMMWHNSCDAAIVRNMIDRLFARAQLAIEESRSLQQLRRSLHEQNEYQRGELRRAVLESASGRSESKAYRENRE